MFGGHNIMSDGCRYDVIIIHPSYLLRTVDYNAIMNTL